MGLEIEVPAADTVASLAKKSKFGLGSVDNYRNAMTVATRLRFAR
jgi:hypothetical protein